MLNTGTMKCFVTHAFYREGVAEVPADLDLVPLFHWSVRMITECRYFHFNVFEEMPPGALTRQAGRFELADQSTIFLHEISELSLDLQSKLLRVIQEGEFERLGSPRTIKVNVRIIASTNRNLLEEVRKANSVKISITG